MVRKKEPQKESEMKSLVMAAGLFVAVSSFAQWGDWGGGNNGGFGGPQNGSTVANAESITRMQIVKRLFPTLKLGRLAQVKPRRITNPTQTTATAQQQLHAPYAEL